MDNVLVWAAVGFAIGMVFGMTTAANLFGGRPATQPTVVYMDHNRPETLAEAGNGCVSLVFMVMLAIGGLAALIVLGS